MVIKIITCQFLNPQGIRFIYTGCCAFPYFSHLIFSLWSSQCVFLYLWQSRTSEIHLLLIIHLQQFQFFHLKFHIPMCYVHKKMRRRRKKSNSFLTYKYIWDRAQRAVGSKPWRQNIAWYKAMTVVKSHIGYTYIVFCLSIEVLGVLSFPKGYLRMIWEYTRYHMKMCVVRAEYSHALKTQKVCSVYEMHDINVVRICVFALPLVIVRFFDDRTFIW